jgi:hypothetical protein
MALRAGQHARYMEKFASALLLFIKAIRSDVFLLFTHSPPVCILDRLYL